MMSTRHRAANPHAMLQLARDFGASGQDESAKRAFLQVLAEDPGHLGALTGLGALAAANGDRVGARMAHLHAARCHPDDAVAQVNYADVLLADGALAEARGHFEAALVAEPGFAEAHQGLARVLTELGDPAAEAHWRLGFVGHATFRQRYCGPGVGVPLLLLVSARGGNVPVRQWIDNRRFAVTGLYAEYYDPSQELPPHALIVNAIGDADICAEALAGATQVVAASGARVINPPDRVRQTGRLENARRLAWLPDVIVPNMRALPNDRLLRTQIGMVGFAYPLLLRSPGFHTGQHFEYVANVDDLPRAQACLPAGADLLAIQYLDARGADGMARKYRVMFVDGACYPLHLAVGADWKVHYFSAEMTTNAAYRQEEQRFLDDMPAVIGPRGMQALSAIAATLKLDYGGADFGLSANGSLLLFEANATMAVNPPDADPMWDYRRPAVAAILSAVTCMLRR